MTHDISMHILEITQNSITAGATLICITITEDAAANIMSFSVTDDGRGMDADFLNRVTDPTTTTRTTRKIGLGLTLLDNACKQYGGFLHIDSVPKMGTTVTATFTENTHPPLGNICDTIFILMTTGNSDFLYVHNYNGATFTLDTRDIKAELGRDIPLNLPIAAAWIKDAISEGLAGIKLKKIDKNISMVDLYGNTL